MSFSDHDLVHQIPHLRRFAISLLRNRDRADDLVQDCLARALAKKGSFRAGSNLRSWLFAILHNLFIDGHRRNGGRTVSAAADLAIEHARVEPRQDDRMLLKELFVAIAALPDAQRFVLLMVAVEGLDYQEAATAIGVPVGTVRSRLSRARRILRDMLEAAGPVADIGAAATERSPVVGPPAKRAA